MTCQLLIGDATEVLATLPAASVQCVITSPPYWNLRDYQCAGQIGLEDIPSAYIGRLVAVFREVRRVLRDDGTLWVNIGDTYCGYHGNSQCADEDAPSNKPGYVENMRATTVGVEGLKPKDLVGIPWMLAFALRADGWYLRSDIIWAKPNPMPESVTDRPTSSHEYLFLLSKSATYYYDAAAIAEDATRPDEPRLKQNGESAVDTKTRGYSTQCGTTTTRNKRDVWTIASQPYPGAHYAVMPAKLVEPCILAGTSPQACEHCGAPWARVTERVAAVAPASYNGSTFTRGKTVTPHANTGQGTRYEHGDTTGWRPTCTHDNEGMGQCVTLDPFFGSGTVGKVALSYGRSFVGIDIDPRNVELARHRIGPMLLDNPSATVPIRRVVDKQAATGNRTAAGFNERWDAKEAAI